MKKKFKDTKVGKIVIPFVRETAQTLPIIGTIITNFKTNEVDNPKGQINLKGNDLYRIGLGAVIAYLIYRGVVSMEAVDIFTDVLDKLG